MDPLYIKVGAVVAGVALLLWPLVPKAIAALKNAVPTPRPTASHGLMAAMSSLTTVKSYLGEGDVKVDEAIDTLAVAVVRKGL